MKFEDLSFRPIETLTDGGIPLTREFVLDLIKARDDSVNVLNAENEWLIASTTPNATILAHYRELRDLLDTEDIDNIRQWITAAIALLERGEG